MPRSAAPVGTMQAVTQIFLEAPIEIAEAALEVASTIVESRRMQGRVAAVTAGTSPFPTPATSTLQQHGAPPVGADGRVRRGRPRRSGLSAILAESVGLPATVPDLPPQGLPDEE